MNFHLLCLRIYDLKRVMKIFNRFLPTWLSAQERIALLLCMGMTAGFFWSRAVLSLSVVMLFVNALHPGHFFQYITKWKKDKFAICCFLFFLTYLLSGLWSADKSQWWSSVTNKLPFAVLPFAYYATPLDKPRYQRLLIYVLVLMQLTVIGYSLFMLFSNAAAYIEGYKHSHALPTTKYDDHIRFSLSLVLSLIMIVYLLFEQRNIALKKWIYTGLLLCGLIFIVYLHILAAKTGLLCLYVAAFIYIFWKVYKRKGLSFGIPAALTILLLPLIAYFTVPTFQLKIDYVVFEISHMADGEKYNYNLSDQGRILSYKMGLNIVKAQPLYGVGAGDVLNEMSEEYQKFYPEVPEQNVLIPHNQYLFTLVALGFPLSIALIMLSISLFKLPNANIYSFITGAIMIIAMLVEAMLEIQFGVFIFLFYILFWVNIKSSRQQDPLSLS